MRRRRRQSRQLPPAADPWPFVESDGWGWPGKQRDAGGDPDLYTAMLAVREKRTDDEIARQAAAKAADEEIYGACYKGAIDVASASLDRAAAAADLVQKSAAAIVTLYTGILAVAFSVTSNPLPFNAVFAVVLLGFAIVLSTVYAAYLPSHAIRRTEADSQLNDRADVANDFVDWMREAAGQRAGALRAAVVALGAALFFLPAPFVGAVDVPWVGHHTAEGAATTSGVPSSPTWPRLASAAKDYPVALQKVVYQAQVDEVASLRAPPSQKQSNGFWWIAFGVALVAIVTVPKAIGEGGRGGGASETSAREQRGDAGAATVTQ